MIFQIRGLFLCQNRQISDALKTKPKTDTVGIHFIPLKAARIYLIFSIALRLLWTRYKTTVTSQRDIIQF